MNTRLSTYVEHRRAVRLDWERPVRITRPVQLNGRSVNASAVGLLVRIAGEPSLHMGDMIALEIPRSDGLATTTRRGRITRLQKEASDTLFALEFV